MRRDFLRVFVKPPRAGEVKTRLAASIGARAAAELARAFFVDTREAIQELDGFVPVLATATDFHEGEWVPPGAAVWPQGAGDLGQRMERISQRALGLGGRSLIIGSDLPGLPPARIVQARETLANYDAVLGPTPGGGYYALRRCPAGLLEGLPWSSKRTLELTVVRFKASGPSLHLLEPWSDVDRFEDLVRLQERIRSGEVLAPRTAEVLARIGLLPGRRADGV
ncbi:MAG TPA: TIGR04282 family arsenosugar biosynthesis glycosyltransferase [Propionicimonas sp.]|jgi:hypothetical protein